MAQLILTPLGQQKAENTEGQGAEYAVISYMYETGGPIDFDELASHIKADEEKASIIVRRLMNQGLIKEV